MTRLTTKLFVVALSSAALAFASTADAGGCSSGGGYGGYRAPRYPTYRPRVIQSAPQPPIQQQPQQFQAPAQQQPQQFQGQTQQPRVLGQQQTPAQQGLGALGNTQQQPQANNQQSAEMTALQALAAMGGNQAQPQPAPQQQPQTAPQARPQQANGNVGTWVAKVGTEATVRLDLRADGSFTWTATRNGKTSNFAGQYNIGGGKLTLTRSDNQKLDGSMTANANGFNFKLSGANDAGLNFARG